MIALPFRRVARASVVATACLVWGPALANAEQSVPATLDQRAQGADRVLVGTVVDTQAAYRVNAHGDRLIVTRARLKVESHWKGGGASVVDVDIEGGTVEGVTLAVSDLPTLVRGERAIFFLRGRPDGAFEPHLRGQGVLKLDTQNMVRGTRLSLDEARRIAVPQR